MIEAANGDAYDDPDAEVMLVSASGGVPIRLARANTEPAPGNSWPRWGPQVDDTAWLAFASRRAYGRIVEGRAQIWLAELNLALAREGLDPSAPAVWLSGQDTNSGNHTPAWVPRNSSP